MELFLCGHIHASGIHCQSPRMKKSRFCYFHDRFHKTHRVSRKRILELREEKWERGSHDNVDYGNLEDHASIQIAISSVLTALAADIMAPRKASALLYGLQLASHNAKKLTPPPTYPEIAKAITERRIKLAGAGVVSWLDEQEYQANSAQIEETFTNPQMVEDDPAEDLEIESDKPHEDEHLDID